MKVNKTTIKSLLLLAFLLVGILSSFIRWDPVRATITEPDWFTEVDPNSKLTQDNDRANWTDMIRDEACYIYISESSGLDFTHLFQFEITDINASSTYILGCLWAVTNNTGRPYFTEVEPVVRLGFKTQNTTHFWLYADQGTGVEYDESIDLSVDTKYYVTVRRVDPIFNFSIYSDIGRDTLIETLTLDVTGLDEEGFTFNYVEMTASYDYTGTQASSGYVEWIDFFPFEVATDWTQKDLTYICRTEEFAHSGILSLEFDDINSEAMQVFSTPVAVDSMDSFTFWVHAKTDLFTNYNIYCKVHYTDDTSTTQQFTGSSSIWVQKDILSGLTSGKSMERVEFYGSGFNGMIDDVSCPVSTVEQISNGGFEDPTGTDGQRIVNEGFEFGSGLAWLQYGFGIETGTVRSGTYSASVSYGSYGYQTIAPYIAVDDLGVFGCYVYPEDQRAADFFSITVEYGDDTADGWTTSSYGSWIYANLTAICDAGKDIERVRFGNGDSMEWHDTFVDDFTLIEEASLTSYECRVVSSPEIAANWEIDGTPYYTPWLDNMTTGIRTLEATDYPTATRDSGQNIYGFSRWLVTDSGGDTNYTTATINHDIQEETNFTIFYENSYSVNVTSTPYTAATFTANGYPFTAPKILTRNNDTHTFVCTLFQVDVNSSYRYTFDYWSINGSGTYYSLNIDVAIAGDTDLTMHYLGSSIESPFIPDFTKSAINGTWYMRSDTHTIHDQLGYRLDTVNTVTSTYDTRTTSGNVSISYGIRVWAIDIFGNNYELSGGSPTAIVTRSTNGSGYQAAYFNCPAHSTLIDAFQVNVYQRFGSDPWSLRRIFNTEENLYYKLPAAQWTIYYYTNRTAASTTARFYHGSSTYASRILFTYYRANPWEIATARLQAQDYFGFIFTPWTYYLGDIFWSLLLLFGIVTAYNRFGSLKPILALLWLFGGVGSFLSALIPAVALPIAWLMLAVAMGITLFKLIYR